MTTAVFLICTTLVTNVGNGSIVTKECHEVQPQTALASPEKTSTNVVEELPPERITNISKEPDLVQETMAAPKANPVVVPRVVSPVMQRAVPPAATVKRFKAKRVKIATHHKRYQKRRVARRVEVMPTVSSATQPTQKLSIWQRLKNVVSGR
jgi:hypothetical protein